MSHTLHIFPFRSEEAACFTIYFLPPRAAAYKAALRASQVEHAHPPEFFAITAARSEYPS